MSVVAFLTGVTKFGKVSVFSDLNNLNDISMDQRYVDVCGLTDKELHDNFDDDIQQLGRHCGLSKEECYAKLKTQYDGYHFRKSGAGYHFRKSGAGLYNPFSILNTLAKLEFADYWFETGTPSFLAYLLKHSNYQLERITEEQIPGDLLGSVDSMLHNPIPIIYQSGYLSVEAFQLSVGAHYGRADSG